MIVALDLETTWLSKEKDFIIEVALIKFDEKTFEIIDEYTTLVNPWIQIPDLNVNITGITNEMVIESPFFDDIKSKIKDFIWDYPILWHNTYFDRDFLIEKWVDIQKNIVLDTYFLSSFLSLKSKSMSLESLTSYYKIELVWAHRAYNDTKSTVLLYKRLMDEFSNLEYEKKQLLGYIFSLSNDSNINYLRNFLFESENKLSQNEFIELQLKKLRKINLDFTVKNDENPIDEIETYFRKIDKFEFRQNQLDMSKTVYNNFISEKKTVIEAPTWIWKTIAYLIPSILYSKQTWKKVFISTKTKILQDQIYFNDLNILKDSLWIDFLYTKVKWRKNYLSLKSYFDFIKNYDVDYEKVSFLSKISLWLCETEFWELDEINYSNSEYKLLKYVNSDNNETLSEKNIFYKNEFLYRQKIKLDMSNIVIVNHSLLFSDLKNDFAIFWNIENLIIDEAHSTEDIATESLKKSFSLKNIEDLLLHIDLIYRNNFIDNFELNTRKEYVLSNLSMFLDVFYNFLKSKTNNENYIISTLVDSSFYNICDEVFYKAWENIKDSFKQIITLIWATSIDFSKEINFFNDIIDILDKMLDKNNSQEFIKIAYFSDYEWVKLEYTILDIWQYLRINFWDYLKNCFLFSATLSIADNFNYIKKSLHLEWFDFKKYESDFDYSKQATLYIPKDLWSIKNNFSKVQDFLKVFFTTIPWNTLVLFTSLAAVRNIYINLNFFVKSLWSKILAQSIFGSKNKIIETFLQEHKNSIILGTDSFWEWIDIPWEPLRYLIIHKMPFAVPTDPIYVSRSKLFSNPFSEYSVPKSILKLKQWFWRLIRTKSDVWSVIFLDDRIYSTDWGKDFLCAFPSNINLKTTTSEEIINHIKTNN